MARWVPPWRHRTKQAWALLIAAGFSLWPFPVVAMGQEPAAEANISVGERALCRDLYESLEDEGFGPSVRTVLEVEGVVTALGNDGYEMQADSVRQFRFILQGGEWITDTASVKRPPVSRGDAHLCVPSRTEERRAASTVRRVISIETLETEEP